MRSTLARIIAVGWWPPWLNFWLYNTKLIFSSFSTRALRSFINFVVSHVIDVIAIISIDMWCFWKALINDPQPFLGRQLWLQRHKDTVRAFQVMHNSCHSAQIFYWPHMYNLPDIMTCMTFGQDHLILACTSVTWLCQSRLRRMRQYFEKETTINDLKSILWSTAQTQARPCALSLRTECTEAAVWDAIAVKCSKHTSSW